MRLDAMASAELLHEHGALLRQHAAAQARCSELIGQQAAEIDRLRVRLMRERASLVVRETALAWEREDRAALEASIPGLPRRAALASRVDGLVQRVQELLRERLRAQRPGAAAIAAAPAVVELEMPVDAVDPVDDIGQLEASLVAADLVICQTGCLSHGAYWRVQDHCRRTGKACVVVEQPDAVRIVRIHQAMSVDSRAD
ncbi:DUF2325 domain-containing protein [Xylophilus sp. GOD-11R]|uniref:DUF2325 domain-containing protein n=1 Tax=Xylophilus sp. GOD-11R TaxID=3089814 RepID=UPI00298CEF50|nr:DUF2325 domain-containing protein [Xylophilus sp. GOD-11R]WPB57488.1 DUF2325 domain-containing protein [Xylophilus sp. GOD-11R]